MTWASIGSATAASTTAAEAPGYVAVTSMRGGTMSGNCATGMRVSAMAPAMVMTMAMTMARRGRRIKTAEIIARRPPQPRGAEGVAAGGALCVSGAAPEIAE